MDGWYLMCFNTLHVYSVLHQNIALIDPFARKGKYSFS